MICTPRLLVRAAAAVVPAAVLLVVASTPHCSAQVFTWQPTDGGLFNAAGNWSPAGGPPNAPGESALFVGTTTQTLHFQTSLTLAGHTIRAGDVTYQLNGTTQTMTGGTGVVVGELLATAAQFTILNGTMVGDLTVAAALGSTGEVTIGAEAVFNAGANATVVGEGGVGSMQLVDGGRYGGTGNLTVGASAGAVGAVQVVGRGAVLTTGAAGDLAIGQGGRGSLRVENGGVVQSDALAVGVAATGGGTVVVSGENTAVAVGALDVGQAGAGTVRIDGGAVVTAAATRLASATTGGGAVTVDGAGSRWNVASLAVGGVLGTNGGTGLVSIVDGAEVTVAGALEIRNSTGSGVTVDGGLLRVGGAFTRLGAFDLRDGELHLQAAFDNGAAAGPLTIDAARPDDLATVRLTNNLPVSNVTTVTVGAANRGLLVLDGGRQLAIAGTNDLLVGSSATGSGQVVLRGAGTALTVSDDVSLGGNATTAQGAGTLSIEPGASAAAAGTLNLFPQGVVELWGGTLTVASLNAAGGRFDFRSGRLQFSAATTLGDPLLDATLGPDHRLSAGRELRLTSGAASLNARLTVDGGDLATESGGGMTVNSTLTLVAGTVSVSGVTNVAATRVIAIGGTGRLDAVGGLVNNGTIVLQENLHPTTGGAWTNNGIIRGSGLIGNVVTNAGTITAVASELQFDAAVVNATGAGLITGRDGTLRFLGGLTNNGSLVVSGGPVDVHGDVDQNVGGRITVTGGGVATFYDDVAVAAGAAGVQASAVGGVVSRVVFLGSYNGGTTGGGAAFVEGDHRPGNSAGLVSFGGDLFYGGDAEVFVELGGTVRGETYDAVDVAGQAALSGRLHAALLGGFAPTLGASFEVLHAEGGRTGGFTLGTMPALPAGLKWNLSHTATSAWLSIESSILQADFSGDGEVDGDDLAAWTGGFGAPGGPAAGDADGNGEVDGADVLVWQRQLGSMNLTAAGSTATQAAPEPSACVLAAGLLALCDRRGLRR